MIYWSPNQVHSFLRFFSPIISFYFGLAHYHPLPQYSCLNSLVISIFWSMILSPSFSGIPLRSDLFLHPSSSTHSFNLTSDYYPNLQSTYNLLLYFWNFQSASLFPLIHWMQLSFNSTVRSTSHLCMHIWVKGQKLKPTYYISKYLKFYIC